MVLHHVPQGLGGQLGEVPPGPGSVIALDEALVDGDLRPELFGHGLHGLPTAFQRAGYQRRGNHTCQPTGQVRGLGAPGVVEVDSLGPTGQAWAGLFGHTVSNEKKGHRLGRLLVCCGCGHGDRLGPRATG